MGGSVAAAPQRAPPLALLAGEQRLSQRSLGTEQLRTQERLDRCAEDASGRAIPEEHVEPGRDVPYAEPLAECHADAAQRPEGHVHGCERDLAAHVRGGT